MAYRVEAVDRKFLPEGKDWMMVETPDGDATFVIANDAGVVLGPEVLTVLVEQAGHAAGAMLTLVG